MTELQCWPLDHKLYTSVDLGAAYAARSRGLLTADSFSATTNGDNTVTLSKGLGCIHPDEFWAAFPYTKNDTVLQFEDADGVYPRWDAIVLGYDKNNNQAGLYVRTGLAAQSPALPEMRRNADYDETFLYRITRPVGATKIEADHIVDLRLDPTYCGLMRDTIDAIDTSVMQAAADAFFTKLEQELSQINAGTAAMLRATYDPQGKNKDIFAAIAACAPLYTATYLLDGWTEADEDAKGRGYNWAQTVQLVPDDNDAPAVTADSIFVTTASYLPTGVVSTDEVLDEALSIIDGGYTTSGAGTVTTLVVDKPTADIPVRWAIRPGVM